MKTLIGKLAYTIPDGLKELRSLRTTFQRRKEDIQADILASLGHPRTSNGPTESINGRLEHLRGSRWDFATAGTI